MQINEDTWGEVKNKALQLSLFKAKCQNQTADMKVIHFGMAPSNQINFFITELSLCNYDDDVDNITVNQTDHLLLSDD